MTRIDFYLLDDKQPNAGLRFACRLAEKAFGLGNRIYIHTESAAQSASLDKLMWTYQVDSFLPHALAGADVGDDTPVIIGHDEHYPDIHEVLINLSATTPACFSGFERVAELVGPDESARQRARERYRYYKDRGYPLDTHTINGS